MWGDSHRKKAARLRPCGGESIETAYLLGRAPEVVPCISRIHRLSKADGRRSNRKEAEETGAVKSYNILDTAGQQYHGYLLLHSLSQHTGRHFAHQGLPVGFALTGQNQIGFPYLFGEMQSVQ